MDDQILDRDELHRLFRKQAVINGALISALIYFLKLTPTDAAGSCFVSALLIFLLNWYLSRKLKADQTTSDPINIRLIIIKNVVTINAWLALGTLLAIISILDVPALVKAYL